MTKLIKISDSAEQCVIDIEGVIGTPEGDDAGSAANGGASYSALREQIAAIARIQSPSVVVNIRSMGGSVHDALLIYDALCALDARITTRCYGYTASAATIIAQAASQGCREISANGLYLIHKSMCTVEGNDERLAEHIELLRKTDERIAAIYAAHSDRDAEHFAALMSANGGEGRWLTPAETVEAGLADRIADGGTNAVGNFVREIADRIATLLHRPKGNDRATDCVADDVADDVAEPQMPADELPATPSPSLIAFDEGQRRAEPTSLRECDDPSDADERPTPNALAYDADAKGMRRGV